MRRRALLGVGLASIGAVACADASAPRLRAAEAQITALQGQVSALQAQAQASQEAADQGQIAQLEAIFHRATTDKDLELVMTIFADDARMIAGEATFVGKEAIRANFANTPLFKPENRWMALTPAQKFRIAVQGDQGSFAFECHYFDLDAKAFPFQRAVTTAVVRAGNRWLIREWRAVPTALSI
jgi:ketosteroid isomerase-like protein